MSILRDVPCLPWPPVPQGGKVNESNKTLIVVPMSNDVHRTGDNQHPSNGLVEGKVLVKETTDGARGTLRVEREERGRGRERGRERRRERERDVAFLCHFQYKNLPFTSLMNCYVIYTCPMPKLYYTGKGHIILCE